MGALDGKRAIVTGAARGIGEATVRRFREEGARVFPVDRDGADAVDVTDEAAIAAAIDEAVEQFGGLDVAVANAGVLTLRPLADLTLAEFEETLRVNVLGTFLTFKHAVTHLRAAGGGTLLCTSSQAGVRGYPELSAYCASKFAVVGLVESLAAELAPDGIRVCAVAPGITDTAMYGELVAARARLWGVDDQEAHERIRRTVPFGRPAAPDEIADAFVYLASSRAAYVSGVTLVVDGAELSG
ncbi:MAG TPA: SDR family oxidoreductase [Gaiellaceae bacterium]|jgi:NAD(P)-dependent dehydrogenase (short-subunit alcohol dehydrogenase family)